MSRIPLPRPQDLLVQLWDDSECSSSWKKDSVKLHLVVPYLFSLSGFHVKLAQFTSQNKIFLPASSASSAWALEIKLCSLCPGHHHSPERILKSGLSWMWCCVCTNRICSWVVLGALWDRYQQGSCAVQILTNKSPPPPWGGGDTSGAILHPGDTKGGKIFGGDGENPQQQQEWHWEALLPAVLFICENRPSTS